MIALAIINAIMIVEKENPNKPKIQFYLVGAITEYNEEIGISSGRIDIFS